MDLLNRRGNTTATPFESLVTLSSLVLSPAPSLPIPSSAFYIFTCIESHGTAGRGVPVLAEKVAFPWSTCPWPAQSLAGSKGLLRAGLAAFY